MKYISCNKLIFAVLTYTEEEIYALETVVSVSYCALERSNDHIYKIDYGTLCFSESDRDPRYVGLIGKKILKMV